MIARRSRNDAFAALRLVERQEFVERASELEGPCGLEVFELQKNPRRVAEVEGRVDLSPARLRADPRLGGDDFVVDVHYAGRNKFYSMFEVGTLHERWRRSSVMGHQCLDKKPMTDDQ